MEPIGSHTPLRQIGYHKSSKSQPNIWNSSPDLVHSTKYPNDKTLFIGKSSLDHLDNLLSYLHNLGDYQVNKYSQLNTKDKFNLEDDQSSIINNEDEEDELLKEYNNWNNENQYLKNKLNVTLSEDNERLVSEKLKYGSLAAWKHKYTTVKEKNIEYKNRLKEYKYLENDTKDLMNILSKRTEISILMSSTKYLMEQFLSHWGKMNTDTGRFNKYGDGDGDDEIRNHHNDKKQQRTPKQVEQMGYMTSSNYLENHYDTKTNKIDTSFNEQIKFSEEGNINTSTENIPDNTDNDHMRYNQIEMSWEDYKAKRMKANLMMDKKEHHKNKNSGLNSIGNNNNNKESYPSTNANKPGMNDKPLMKSINNIMKKSERASSNIKSGKDDKRNKGVVNTFRKQQGWYYKK